MNRSQSYVIYGDPIPLARPRFNEHGANIYDSQKDKKLISGISIRKCHSDSPFFSGPVSLDITFYMPMCRNDKRRRKQQETGWHVYRPDLSNMIKFIEDVAEKICYQDDCIIAEIYARKRYAEITRTEFTLKELE